jgi:hypothetical protein
MLRRMTAEVDEQHRAAMATIDEDLAEAHFGTARPAAPARRQFLQRAAAGAAVAIGGVVLPMGTLAAAAQDDGGDTTSTTDPTGGTTDDTTGTTVDGTTEDTTEVTTGAEPGVEAPSGAAEGEEVVDEADLAVVRFAESVERAAVAAYGLAEASGKLATDVLESARTFGLHHGQHAAALLTLSGSTDPMAANPALVEAVGPLLEEALDAETVIEVLYDLEEAAAATYLFAIGELAAITVAGAAATILPVEAQHAAVWGRVLGRPTDDYLPAVQTDDAALDPSDYPAGNPVTTTTTTAAAAAESTTTTAASEN